jgi:pyruvate kinase
VKGIVTFTSSGTTARSIAKYRPDVPIFAVTHSEEVLRRLAVVWGVKPLFTLPKTENPEQLIELFRKRVVKEGVLQRGDRVIATMGSLVGREGTTNMIRILEI